MLNLIDNDIDLKFQKSLKDTWKDFKEKINFFHSKKFGTSLGPSNFYKVL